MLLGFRLPLLVLGRHRQVDPLDGHDPLGDPTVERLLRRDSRDLGGPGDLVDGPLLREPGGQRVVDVAELGLVAVDASPALYEPPVGHGLRGPLADAVTLGLPRVGADPLGDGGEGLALRDAVGDFDPLIEGEMLLVLSHVCSFCFLVGNGGHFTIRGYPQTNYSFFAYNGLNFRN